MRLRPLFRPLFRPYAAGWRWRTGLVGLCFTLATPMAVATELNTASQAELEQVKGVGPQLSDRLLAERRNGPFRDWPDVIRRMKGVGPASAAKLSAGGLTVAGTAYRPAERAQVPKAPTAASAVSAVSTASPLKP